MRLLLIHWNRTEADALAKTFRATGQRGTLPCMLCSRLEGLLNE